MNKEESEQNEVDRTEVADTGKATYLYQRLVMCNEEDTGGQAKVTADEERLLVHD